jgi:hypothetical protein
MKPTDAGYHLNRIATGGGAFGPKWRPHLTRTNGVWVVRYVNGLVRSREDLSAAERWAMRQNGP